MGDTGSFSLYGNKIITTGEGGMITTSDQHLADTMRTLKGQGVDPNRRYWHPVIGYNYRMTNIEAVYRVRLNWKISAGISEEDGKSRIYITNILQVSTTLFSCR